MTNTSQYIPFESVAPIILKNPEFPDLPFFSGTGFFAHFPPYDDIFFITAKHCIEDYKNNSSGTLIISYDAKGESKEVVNFSEYLLTEYLDDNDGLEDVAVYVVGETTHENREVLKKRCLRLQHQDNVDLIIEYHINNNGKIRTVGFPSASKDISHKENKATSRPRGFHGNITGASGIKNRYKVEQLSWSEGELSGFSGSPILALHPNEKGEIQAIAIGILLTGSSDVMNFLSINVATDLIAKYIINKHKLTT